MSDDSPLVEDRIIPEFDRDVKQLTKRYRNTTKDIEAFARLLDARPTKHRGNRVAGFGSAEVYKARVISRDLRRGKSGGFRVILLRDVDIYRFIMIYTHNTEPSEANLRQKIHDRLLANGLLSAGNDF